jgi:hypothetical protein
MVLLQVQHFFFPQTARNFNKRIALIWENETDKLKGQSVKLGVKA